MNKWNLNISADSSKAGMGTNSSTNKKKARIVSALALSIYIEGNRQNFVHGLYEGRGNYANTRCHC